MDIPTMIGNPTSAMTRRSAPAMNYFFLAAAFLAGDFFLAAAFLAGAFLAGADEALAGEAEAFLAGAFFEPWAALKIQPRTIRPAMTRMNTSAEVSTHEKLQDRNVTYDIRDDPRSLLGTALGSRGWVEWTSAAWLRDASMHFSRAFSPFCVLSWPSWPPLSW